MMTAGARLSSGMGVGDDGRGGGGKGNEWPLASDGSASDNGGGKGRRAVLGVTCPREEIGPRDASGSGLRLRFRYDLSHLHHHLKGREGDWILIRR
jgi:hypothetical protein